MSTKPEGSATDSTAVEAAENDESTRVDRMQAQMGRRKFMAASAGTAAAVVATSGLAAAETATVNFSSDVVQNPRVQFDVTVGEHTGEMSSALEFVNDSGESVSLADHGASLQERADDSEAHNPVTLRADKFAAAEYRSFPRGATYENGDGDEQDLDVVDAQHWTTDASGGGSLTLETVEGMNGADALRISTSGQTSGDSVTATFTDVDISSGIERKYLQLVATIASLDSGAVVTVRLRDSSSNTLEAVIDGSADSTAIGTIATATGAGVVYQEQLGKFSTSLEDVTELELEIAEANADVTFPGINLERESRWEFGTREVLNDDDELETETVVEPSGEFSITELSSLPDVFAGGAIMDVESAIGFHAADLESSMRRARWGDAEPYDFPHRLETLVGFEPPTAYDLSYSGGTAVDEVLFPETRYNYAGFARESELPSWGDVDDDSVTFTSRTGTYEGAEIGEDVEITPSVSTGEVLVVYADVLLSDQQQSTATSMGGGAVGPMGGGGGFLGSPLSIIMTVLATVGGYVAHVKGWIPGIN